MKKIIVFIILSFSLSILSAQTAGELNVKGFRFYEKSQYEEALEYFRLSFEKDNTYYKAFYNYACTAALLIEQNLCENLRHLYDIFDMLSTACELHPSYKEKMLVDPDLEFVRRYYVFYIIAGFDLNNRSDFIDILINVSWFGPSRGVFPPSPTIDFSEKGKVKIGFFSIAGEADPGYSYISGSYFINNNIIFFKMDTDINGRKEFSAELINGQLHFEDDILPVLSDDDDPCSA